MKELDYFNPFHNITSKRVLKSSFFEKCADTFLVFTGWPYRFNSKDRESHLGLFDYIFFPVSIVMGLLNCLLPEGLACCIGLLFFIAFAALAFSLTVACLPMISIVHGACAIINHSNESVLEKENDLQVLQPAVKKTDPKDNPYKEPAIPIQKSDTSIETVVGNTPYSTVVSSIPTVTQSTRNSYASTVVYTTEMPLNAVT